jgi:hypothetical protein
VRFVALRFLGVPLAIWIVCAYELIDFGGALNLFFVFAFPSQNEAGAADQHGYGDNNGGEVLHRTNIAPSTLHHKKEGSMLHAV